MNLRSSEEAIGLVRELCKYAREAEWLEFKRNDAKPEEIGEYISALANTSALEGKPTAYLIWGVDDKTHDLIGTQFSPGTAKVGNEALENWLLRLLEPKIDFRFYELSIDQKPVILLEIGRAFRHSVRFQGQEYIRIGSHSCPVKV